MIGAVQDQFRDLVISHSQRVGFAAPETLQFYLADILAERFDRPDFIPTPTFAEAYLRLYESYRPGVYRDFADSTLIFCSLLPQYGRRRGISMDYYATLGISTYYALGDLAHDSRFTQLGNWFYHLQQFLNSLLHPDSKLAYIKI
jgi:hypothetical protein